METVMTIEEAINSSKSMREAAKKLGMPFSTFRRKAGDLYKPNQSGKGISKGSTTKIPLDEILKGNFPSYSTNRLRERLIKEGIKEHKCEICEGTTWQGKPIPIELDHINGIKNDHRLANLRILCPNCHAQTETYCGKNIKRRKNFNNDEDSPQQLSLELPRNRKKPSGNCQQCGTRLTSFKQTKFCSYKCSKLDQRKVDRPSKEELDEDIQNLSWLAIGRKYKVSDNAVRKWARSYELI